MADEPQNNTQVPRPDQQPQSSASPPANEKPADPRMSAEPRITFNSEGGGRKRTGTDK